ncbi:MAG: tRNA (adenosine(37)-N6)-threonylcarbamoyltransferase complex dimerization subunit type 1 TsaB [Rhodoferax sp.]|jgi:tRNA threonylcarbamoyladenosine biosynthesis protein TsaB|nr:tRNA (adenosine(37)-N6)-threonylcarbamoyltransferase complex dimerization subunit type 1 TsaB [Rhodoferax sp.]
MNLLAFDTSTEWMSVAVQRGWQAPPWHHSVPGGALTSTQLIPCILALMAQAGLSFAALDAIVLGAGPGSFTGLRTACAVAQGLAFGANVPVLPVSTLLAVAEEARLQCGGGDGFCVSALLDARMDEIYFQRYRLAAGRWSARTGCRLIKPEHLKPADGDDDEAGGTAVLAGNVFDIYGARLPGCGQQRIAALPTAHALLRLAPKLLADGAGVPAAAALPTYVRDKVAQTTLERSALKLAGALR